MLSKVENEKSARTWTGCHSIFFKHLQGGQTDLFNFFYLSIQKSYGVYLG